MHVERNQPCIVYIRGVCCILRTVYVVSDKGRVYHVFYIEQHLHIQCSIFSRQYLLKINISPIAISVDSIY